MAQDITGYLKAVPTDDQTRAQAWEVYNNPANQQDFEQRVGKLNIPSQAKADLWEAKYGSGKLDSPSAPSQSPPTNTQPSSQPSAQPAPSAGKGVLAKGWDWLNSPVNVGHLRENIQAGENNDPGLKDAKDLAAHPILHPLEQGVKDFATTFGTGAAKMFLTPLGIGMAALGPLARGTEAVAEGVQATRSAIAAKTVLSGIGIGFGAKGATNIVQQPGKQPGESSADYVTRMAGNAAMIAGGSAGVAEAPHVAKDIAGRQTPTSQARVVVDPIVAAQARVQQAVGGPGVPVAQTIHVDPDFATELHQWNQSDLPSKRVILKTNPKSGEQTVHLAHSDPDVQGFQYTNTTSSNVYSDTGAPGQVPVELSKSNGVRGTATPGHFLANQIVGDMPVAAPETPAPATAAAPPIQPPTSEVATPPAPAPQGWQNHPNFQQPEVAPVVGSEPTPVAKAPDRRPLAERLPQQPNLVDDTLRAEREARRDAARNMQPGDSILMNDGTSHVLQADGTFHTGAAGFRPDSMKTPLITDSGKINDGVTGWLANGQIVKKTHSTVPKTVEKIVVPADPARGVKEVKLSVTEGEATPPVATPVSGAVRLGQNPLPAELSKSAPRFGYGNKLFQLQFDDPHDLAAYTLGQAKDNAAQAKFVKYLQSEYPDATLQDLKDHALGVRGVVKELAKTGNPDEGPLKIPSQGGIATSADDPKGPLNQAPEEPKFPTSQATTPPVDPKPLSDVSPLEDKIRPLVGQVMRLGQLRTGEAASHAIDTAIEQTHSLTGSLNEDLQKQMSSLLKEPVGKNLTGAQIDKLETLRGASVSKDPEVLSGLAKTQNGRTIQEEEMEKDPDAWQRRLDASMVAMTQALNDPDTSPELAKKLTRALTDRDDRPWLYEKDTIRYPKPEALDASHPEAPFAANKLGHEITRINLRNYESILGSEPKDLFLGRDKKSGFVTPEENQQYEDLKDSNLKEVSGNFGLEDLIGRTDEFGNSTGSGSKFSAANSTSPEFRAFDRDLRQRVLARKFAQTTQSLKGQVGEWNKQRNGASTALTDQLAKLSPEVRKYLPQELFNYEKSSSSQTDSSSSSTRHEQPVKTPNKVKASSAAPKSGAATPYEGITRTRLDISFEKNFPTEAQHLPLLQSSVADRYPVGARQAMYERVLQTYAEGVKANAPGALRTALEIAANKGEAGFLDLNFGKTNKLNLTNEQDRASNLDYADRILERWENMTPNQLAAKGSGLWDGGTLARRIASTYPISDDPNLRVAQMEDHNELLDRYNTLKQQVGQAPSVYHSLMDWSQKMFGPRPQEGLIRSISGKFRRDVAIRAAIFNSVSKLADSIPAASADRIWHHIQMGEAVPFKFEDVVPRDILDSHAKKYGSVPDMNELIGRLRDGMAMARDEYASRSGNLQNYLENYMAGEYTNVAGAKGIARRVSDNSLMSGGSDFLKQKTYDFQLEALKAGLDPITNNFVRRSLLTIDQLSQATRPFVLRDQFVDAGYAQQFDPGDVPSGWKALEHPTFGQGDTAYFASPDKARTFNNYVSRGLAGRLKVIPHVDWSLYDALRHSNNLQNMAQLSFSAFHASDIAYNSALTNLEVAGRRIVNEGLFGGRLGKTPGQRLNAAAGGIWKALQTPIAPAQMFNDGRNLEINYADPTKMTSYDRTAADLEAVNANIRPDRNFRLQQLDRFKTQWDKATDENFDGSKRALAFGKAIVHGMAVIPELSNYPLMGAAVPALKAGALHTVFEQVHREFDGSSPDVLNAELQKAGDSIDNRFGELNSDNIFWNRTVKDVYYLMSRSFGWFMGTARELGGGIKDIPGTVGDIVTGKPVHVSGRTMYVGTMIATTLAINAMRNYLLTGTKAQGADYLYPRNGTFSPQGEANRDYPKFSYVYEGINWTHDPLSTAEHKLAPQFGTAIDVAHNQNYFHRQIYDPGAPPMDNVKSFFGFVAGNSFVPFSVENYNESKLRGGGSLLGSAMGIIPAPRWVGRSSAENLANHYFEGDQGNGPQSAQRLEKKADFIDLRNRVAQGKVTDDQIQEALDSGKLQPKMVQYLYRTRNEPQIVTWTKELKDGSQVWNVWQAASPEEKKILLPTVIEKVINLDSGKQQEDKLQELETFANQQ